MNVSGTIIENSDCTISQAGGLGSLISFGNDVYISKIDGVSYKKTSIPVSIKCSNNSNGIVKISFQGTGVGSGCGKLLCTTIQGLGLQLYAAENKLDLGKFFYSQLINGNVDSPEFYVVPVKIENSSLKAGEFASVVTMIVGIV
ncbi:hypothetical protein E2R52_04400 [Pantoea ananatis]|nr:hypothetical protein CG430_04690 [Pantoea ananatis]TDL59394.1 hypothetical protein E2R52_04400 [Pantoea ananatis]